MSALKHALDGWGPSSDEYYLYELWRAYQILPFAGGWLDQPVWVHDLFHKAGLHDRWMELDNKLPSAAGLPRFGA